MTHFIIDAITAINPNAQVDVVGNSYDGINWKDTPVISEADINAKLAEIPSQEELATAKENLKASAKAKLIAGEPMTEEEANLTLHL
jgi:hypothetical protein